ncbi:cation diffusion facilitator family transporter [Leptospira stimsonii]|nr:cation diffusion facilitator family transporter [Leptospira stimsonii]
MTLETEMIRAQSDEKNLLLKKRASILALLVSGTLLIFKSGTGWWTDSIAVWASAMDSGLDFLTSLINLFAILVASKPADEDHRYGHGKAEAIAGLLQSLFIFLSGSLILYKAVHSFFDPPKEIQDLPGIVVMVFSLSLTIFLVLYQRYVLRKTGSLVISADSVHYSSDILSNGAVILSLIVVRITGTIQIDFIVGSLIALYVIWSSARIFRSSVDILMDKDVSHFYRPSIARIIQEFKPEVFGFQKLRTRSVGDLHILEFHLSMPGNLTLDKIKNITDSVEERLKLEFPTIEVWIHPVPLIKNEIENSKEI